MESASYFDWLGTPHQGLVKALRANLNGCFLFPNLELSADGDTVLDRETGISYRHYFSKVPGSKLIDRSLLHQDHSRQIDKLKYLAEKWFATLREETILFVRHDAPSREQVSELMEAIEAQSPAHGASLLLIVPPDHALTVSDERVYVEPESTPSDWPGNDDSWSRILSGYWPDQAGWTRRRAARAAPVGGWDAVHVKAPVTAPAEPLVLFHTAGGTRSKYRLAAIAVELKRLAPSTRILFLIEGPDTDEILDFYHLPYLSLPERAAVYQSAAWRSWPVETKRAAVKGAAAGLLKSARPDILVSDGPPSIFIAHEIAAAAVPVLLCIPEDQFSTCLGNASVPALLNGAAKMLVPVDGRAKTLPPPEDLPPGSVEFIGRLGIPEAPRRVSLRRKFELASRCPIVLADFDCDGEPVPRELPLANLFQAAMRRILAPQTAGGDLAALLVLSRHFSQLPQLAMTPGVRLAFRDPEIVHCWPDAGVLVTTTRHHGWRSAAMPRATVLLPDQSSGGHSCSPDELAALILNQLASPQQSSDPEVARPSGATQAASRILDTLQAAASRA